jgi:hypothetical protein
MLAEIGRSLDWSPDTNVALLRFYGDAGGTRDKSNVAVGGYLSTFRKWAYWKKHWNEMLIQESVDAFHRSEMEPPFWGEFKRKRWTKKHQQPVLNSLHEIIKKHTLFGVGHSVVNEPLLRLMPQQILTDLGGPYGWCLQLCLVDVGSRARDNDDWVHYIFELGDDGQEEIKKALGFLSEDAKYRELLRIAGYTFSPKKGPGSVMQLQAADFMAYEAYKRVENILLGCPRPPRGSALDLVREGIDGLGLWTEDLVVEWIKRANQHPRIQDYLRMKLG